MLPVYTIKNLCAFHTLKKTKAGCLTSYTTLNFPFKSDETSQLSGHDIQLSQLLPEMEKTEFANSVALMRWLIMSHLI